MNSCYWSRLVVALGFCLAASAAHAASVPDTVRGRVVDASGKPVSGAEVVAVEIGRMTVSNATGDFAIETALPATLMVRRAGYATQTARVRSTNALQLVMPASPFPIDPINVTATRAPRTTTSSLAGATLTREALQREAGVSLAHELNTIPGVRTLSTGEQVGKPVVRGLYGSRVLVLEDAMRLEDYSWSDEDAPSIDARFADRVEVVRGPASILYGSDALGGVVNVIPAPVPQAGERFMHSGVELSASSNRREGGLTGRAEGATRTLGWRALAVGRFAEDFRTPVGPVENTGFGALNGELAVGTQKQWGTLTLRYARYAGEFKLLEKEGPSSQPGAAEDGPERKLSDDRLQLIGAFPLAGMRIETRTQLQRHWLQEVADELTPAGQPKVEAPVFELLLNTFSTDVIAHHSLARNVNGSVGASVVAQSNDSRGELPVVPDASIFNAGTSIIERLTSGALELIAGARVDRRSIDPAETKGLAIGAATNSSTAATYNLGVVLHAARAIAFRANLGRAWRAPNLFELYAYGPRIGEARYEIGDATLTPETGTELDGGFDVSTRVLRTQLSVYSNDIHGFIALQPTSEFKNSLRVYRHQQADARLRGIEALAEVRVSGHVNIFGEYDAVRGTNRQSAEPLPWIPAPRLQTYVEIAGPAASFTHSYARIGIEHAWAKTRVAANEPADIGAYTLLNLSAGGVTKWNGHGVRIDAGVKNALNAKYKEFLNRYREFAYDPGRDITLRLSFDL